MTARLWRALGSIAFGAIALVGPGQQASADPIAVSARFVHEDGKPIAGLDVRLVIGSEPGSRDPGSGKRLVTSSDGRVTYSVNAPVRSRSITLDNVFVRHPARTIEVGVEMELLGRRALYWVTIDLVRAGPLGGMTAYLPGKNGRFDRQMVFHADRHSFSLPDDPGGMLMSSIGADLKSHAMSGSDGGPWTVELLIEKQRFSMR